MSAYTDAVYQILVEECGADSYHIHMFNHVWPGCNEYRFLGNQGFGGKIWAPSSYGPAYVTNYSEDDNPERSWCRARANERLAALKNLNM